MHAVKLHCC